MRQPKQNQNDKVSFQKRIQTESDSKMKSGNKQVPDGSWAWVIIAGNCLVLFVLIGHDSSLTLLFQYLLQKFEGTTEATAWVPSCYFIFKMGSSPICAAVINKIGLRKAAILGGLLTFLGVLITAFAPCLEVVYFGYGVITAIGMNITLMVCLSIPGIYFKKNRPRASSISLGLGSIGGMVYPPLMKFFYDVYGYNGLMLLLAGFALHCPAVAILYSPLERKASTEKEQVQREPTVNIKLLLRQNSSTETATRQEEGHSCCRLDQGSGVGGEGESSVIEEDGENDLGQQIVFKKYNFEISKSDCVHTIKKLDCNNSVNDINEVENSPLSTFVTQQSPTNSPSSIINCEEHAEDIQEGAENGNKNLCCDGQFLNMALYKNGDFIIWCISYGLSYFSLSLPMVMLAGLAEENGLSNNLISLLLVLNSGTVLIGRFFSGFLFDIPIVRKNGLFVFTIMGMLISVMIAITPLMTTVPGFFTIILIERFLEGIQHTQTVTVVTDKLSSSYTVNSLAYMRVFSGLGAFGGPVVGGYIRDVLGSYSYVFYTGGLILFLNYFLYTLFCLYRHYTKDNPYKWI